MTPFASGDSALRQYDSLHLDICKKTLAARGAESTPDSHFSIWTASGQLRAVVLEDVQLTVAGLTG